MSKHVPSKLIWTDKKRWLGLQQILFIFPTSFTKYTLTEKALILQTGVFSIKKEQILLYRITDISLQESLLERICGVGTLTIKSKDQTLKNLKIQHIKNPEWLVETLNEEIEKSRHRNRVFSKEKFHEGDTREEDDYNEDTDTSESDEE